MRGYVIAADRQFLQPYYEGPAVGKGGGADIRLLVQDRRELLGDLTAIEQAADAWRRSYAEPFIASRRAR